MVQAISVMVSNCRMSPTIPGMIYSMKRSSGL